MSDNEMVVAIVSMAMGVGALGTLAWAYVERLKVKRGRSAPPELQSIDERLSRMENAIDTMALEVERIAEGQRFTTKLLSDKAGVPSGPALPPR